MQQGSLAIQPRPAAGQNKPANSRTGVRLHCQWVEWGLAAARFSQAALLLCLIFGVHVSAHSASVFVARRGWHIDVGFAVADLTAPLNVIAMEFPGARYLFFGFGDRQYLHAAHHGAPILLRALWPGQGLVLATALGAAPTAAFGRDSVVELSISRDALANVQSFIWTALSPAQRGAFEGQGGDRGSPGPYSGSVFLDSGTTYSAFHTCNTWAAEALHSGELPIRSRGVVFAGQLWRQVRERAAPAPVAER